MFIDILKVGAISCLAPLQSVLTILIFTKILAGFGTETLAGYGMGSRLEFLLIPITFAFGVASVPMVGMAMGAGLVTRARQVAWTAAAAAGLSVGLVGLIVAIKPALWVSLFTSDPGVTAAAYSYFAWAGPAFGFFGTGHLPVFLLAGRCEGRRAGAGRHRQIAAGRPRRLVAGVDRTRRPGRCSRWSPPPWPCSASAPRHRCASRAGASDRRAGYGIAQIRFIVMQARFPGEWSMICQIRHLHRLHALTALLGAAGRTGAERP